MQMLAVRETAIELYATNPEMTHEKAAEMLGIDGSTLRRMRKDPDFWQAVYDSFMVTFDGVTVDVLKAMIREAKAGNVQAGRLILEHSGRLQKNINITVTSPYEKWLQTNKVQDAEIISDLPDELGELGEFEQLPPRTADNSPKRAKEEIKKLSKEVNKAKNQKKRNEDRKIWRSWQKRAKLAGVDPLPARRPTPGQRKAWEKEIIKKEKLASELLQEQVGSNKIPYKPKSQKQASPKPPTHPKT